MPRTKQLEGIIGVVTGGTQGLGEAIARLFAERGAAGLVVCGRNQSRGSQIAKDLSHRCPTHFVQADLSKVEDGRKVVAEADRQFGKIHALVNCAAITNRGTILNTSPELFDEIMAVNLRAPFFLMQETIKVMIRESIAGSIVNIQSNTAHGGLPFISAYSTSKGGLAILTKNVAFSVLRNRIRVNGINVGWMDTPGEDLTQRTYHDGGDTWLSNAEKHQPFGRLLKPEEVARAVAFLCSEESGMMTGTNIDFDQVVQGCFEQQPHPSHPMSLES